MRINCKIEKIWQNMPISNIMIMAKKVFFYPISLFKEIII